MRSLVSAGFVAAFALSAPLASSAKDVHVKEAEVPPAVLASVTQKYPQAKLLHFIKETDAKGKVGYEIETQESGRNLNFDLSAEGKILVEERSIAVADLPAPAKEVLAKSKYASWKIQRLEVVVFEGNEAAPFYEMVVARGKRSREIHIDADGKLAEGEAARTPPAPPAAPAPGQKHE
jgi:hypothetical protein